MANPEIRDAFYRMLLSNNEGFSLLDYLNSSSSDSILEIDFNANKFSVLYNVAGKYFAPLVDDTYEKLYRFSYEHVVHPEDRDVFRELMNPKGFMERLEQSPLKHFRYARFRYRLQNGGWRWVEQCLVCGEENGIAPNHARMFVFDFHNYVKRIQGQENNDEYVISMDRDPLTGLLTDKNFIHMAEQLIQNSGDKNWCLVCLDIEHFRLFDEWYGRSTGDYLLAEIGVIASRLANSCGGIAGYFLQDDFCVLLPHNPKHIQRLYDQIRVMILDKGNSVGFSPAFGICMLSDAKNLVDAIDKASIAVAKAKGNLHQRTVYYDISMHEAEEKEYRILSEFMQALDRGEITFYLQPQCRVSTKKIVGAEALSRWIKTDGTVVPPCDFIPPLEKYGFIADLDQHIWNKVAAWIRAQLDAGRHPVPVSLNISRNDIFTIDIPEFFTQLTKKYRLPRKYLKLEITESAYSETTGTISELVKKLRKAGFAVLMDDFGSGYSSLNMLSNLKFDGIKLDSGFLNMNPDDKETGIHILESVVSMAKVISMPIIVEGVETKDQCTFLEGLGVRYVQGFYFYRPIPIPEFEKMLNNPELFDDSGIIVKSNEQFHIREFLDATVFSDTMLNNILGAVAIYSWHGHEVDIVRYNEQFYESVGASDFAQRLNNIQNFLPEEDKPKIYALLKKAKKDRLNGSSGTLRFARIDGVMTVYDMHFYYMGKREGEDSFYGSAKRITEITNLQQKIALIGEVVRHLIAFISQRNGKYVFEVLSNGLESCLGLSTKQLEETMNALEMCDRIPNARERERFHEGLKKALQAKADFRSPVHFSNKEGKPTLFDFDMHYVGDRADNVQFMFTLRLVEE